MQDSLLEMLNITHFTYYISILSCYLIDHVRIYILKYVQTYFYNGNLGLLQNIIAISNLIETDFTILHHLPGEEFEMY